MKTPITCWQCETEYDLGQHEDCPLCDANWTEGLAGQKDRHPEPGTRVSVIIDHDKGKVRTIPALCLLLILSLSSCSRHTCPTYAAEPIPKYPPELTAEEKPKLSLMQRLAIGGFVFMGACAYSMQND